MEITMDIPEKALREMYVTLVRIRKFEERVAELVSKKEIICFSGKKSKVGVIQNDFETK